MWSKRIVLITVILLVIFTLTVCAFYAHYAQTKKHLDPNDKLSAAFLRPIYLMGAIPVLIAEIELYLGIRYVFSQEEVTKAKSVLRGITTLLAIGTFLAAMLSFAMEDPLLYIAFAFIAVPLCILSRIVYRIVSILN